MFHVKHPAWVEDAAALGIELSDPSWEALDAYRSMLATVAIPRGTIAASDEANLWGRHIRDGLRAVSELRDDETIADLGSGAGIPGVPLAIALPSASFVLIEVRRARAAFLEAVRDELQLTNVDVVLGRVESLRRPIDVAMARAFAPPLASWQAASGILSRSGKLIYWAGERFDAASLEGSGVSVRVSTRSGLADDGPLVIMARQ